MLVIKIKPCRCKFK